MYTYCHYIATAVRPQRQASRIRRERLNLLPDVVYTNPVRRSDLWPNPSNISAPRNAILPTW